MYTPARDPLITAKSIEIPSGRGKDLTYFLQSLVHGFSSWLKNAAPKVHK
jgi:hypothetical protein